MRWFVRRRVTALGLVAGLVGLSAGCGGVQYAEVSGKVSHKGQPVTAGSVYFVSTTDPNLTAGCPLKDDGTFTGFVPVGRAQAAVQTLAYKPSGAVTGPPQPPPAAKGGPPRGSTGPKVVAQPTPNPNVISKTGSGGPGSDPGKYVPIPDKYERVDTSGLEFDIKPGKNELNIDLP